MHVSSYMFSEPRIWGGLLGGCGSDSPELQSRCQPRLYASEALGRVGGSFLGEGLT